MLTVYCSPLRASLLQQKTMMHDDADVDDAAYDVRPTLVPAEDILVCTCIYLKANMSDLLLIINFKTSIISKHFLCQTKNLLLKRKVVKRWKIQVKLKI